MYNTLNNPCKDLMLALFIKIPTM